MSPEFLVDGGKNGENEGTRFEYDALGRQIAKIDPSGNRVETVYDKVGNPVFITTPTGITENVYDLSNRLLQTVNPLGEITSQEHDANGNVISQRDALGHTTRYFYDQLNRKIGVIDALEAETTFDYDPNNNLKYLTDANGGVSTFEYDNNNRKISEKRPMDQETMYFYTDLGQIAAVVYNGGNLINYTYNAVSQPVTVAYKDNELYAPTKTVNYTYDLNGNLSSYNDGMTSASYTYDDLHRKTEETVNYPNFPKTISYRYPDNWQQTFTGPDGNTITADYDKSQRLESIYIPGPGQVDYGNYDWRRPQSITLGGTHVITKQYDALQRTIEITAVNSSLMHREYEYDAVGNVVSKDTEHGLYTYQYDALHRLTEATNPSVDIANEQFSYDKLGNRITDSVNNGIALEYNNNNELTKIDSIVPVYNANGHMTEKPWSTTNTVPQKYTYDATNRLKEIKNYNQDTIAEYYYDPFGRRLWKDVTEDTTVVRTYYMYSKEGLIAEFDANGDEICSYGYVPGSTWTTNPLFQKRNGSYYWYLNDHIGTPQKMIDTAGMVVWAARYDSFGNTVIDTETIENNLRFSGQYFDAESGLHYNWNRYYDPFLGRYLQTDPLGLDAGMNFFVYANGNPLNNVDSLGLFGIGSGGTPSEENTTNYTVRPNTSADLSVIHNSEENTTYTGGQTTYRNRITGEITTTQTEVNPISRWLRPNGLGDSVARLMFVKTIKQIQRLQSILNFNNKGDDDDSTSRYEGSVNIQPTIDTQLLEMSPWAFGREHEVSYLGAEDSWIFSTGSIESLFVEAVLPFAHNFAKFHDYLVSNLVNSGIPRSIANLPTMPIAYIVSAIVTIPTMIIDLFCDDVQSAPDNWERESKPGGQGGY